MPFLTLGGATLRYDRAGAGPTVLLIHGWLGNRSFWERQITALRDRFTVVTVDLRGHGDSDHPEELLVGAFHRDPEALVGELGRDDIALVGHSMGGVLAQRLAELDLVEAAALITPAPPRGITVMTWQLAIRQLKYLPAIVTSRPVRPSREDVRALVMNRVPRDQQDEVIDRLVPDSGRAGRELSITGVAVDASRVRCPLLVVAAEDDRFIPAKTVARVARRYGVPARVMPDHGHMIVLEPGWQELAGIVADWFATMPARAANQPVAP